MNWSSDYSFSFSSDYVLYFHVAEVSEAEDKETNDEVEYEVDELENENLGEDIDIDEALDMVSENLLWSCAWIYIWFPSCMWHQDTQ